MPQPTESHRPPGFLKALWSSFLCFLASLFRRSPSAASLPIPVTTRPSKAKPNTSFARPTSGSVRVAHQRISLPHSAWVKEPTPLKHPKSAASSLISSTARTTPVCRSRSVTPKRALSDPEYIFHPPPSPFPNISFSGIFATSPLLSSPRLTSDVELARLSLASPAEVQTLTPVASPGSPSPFRSSEGAPSPSFHAFHSGSPCTPRTPSSAVLVQLDRSAISPTTMSDGSLEVISLGDRPAFPDSPVILADFGRLPSPWSPIGKTATSDVWVSFDGMLTNATGPVVDTSAQSLDDFESVALRTAMLSNTSLDSTSSALNALGISVFVNLDEMGDQGDFDTMDDPGSAPKLNQVRDENLPTLVTPCKRRDTLPSVSSHGTSCSARAIKCLSTPLTKLDNAGVSHIRSATSISSMAYELRMGLFADGRSITAFENIISLLDQASPESIRTAPHHDTVQPVVVG